MIHLPANNFHKALWRDGGGLIRRDIDFPARALLSNRLYAFKFNPAGNSGIPFEVGVTATEELRIRVFSPLWSQDESEYLIRFAN